MDERYTLADRPAEKDKEWAVKPIGAGKLKNKTAIDPQWRIDKMTEIYGLCGIGWKAEVDHISVEECPTKEKLVFMTVNLYIKDGDGWSGPIVGVGGDKIVAIEKGSPTANDEAWKKCFTDAIGNAMKYIGIGAEIYRGKFEYNKYVRGDEPNQTRVRQSPPDSLTELQGRLRSLIGQNGINGREFANWLCGKQSCMELTKEQVEDCIARFDDLKGLYAKAMDMRNTQR